MDEIWFKWGALWNGDFAQAAILSPDFRLHAQLLDGTPDSAIRGPEAFVQWIAQARAPFDDLRFATDVGPLPSGAYITGRWIATGTYVGGFPGAKAAARTVVSFAGTDILRIENGLIAEYWVSSDTLSLLAQLGVRSK